jgi:hypothetical protein
MGIVVTPLVSSQGLRFSRDPANGRDAVEGIPMLSYFGHMRQKGKTSRA